MGFLEGRSVYIVKNLNKTRRIRKIPRDSLRFLEISREQVSGDAQRISKNLKASQRISKNLKASQMAVTGTAED